MTDILFDNQGKLLGTGSSDAIHQQDLLLMHKGWQKFKPHFGVGVLDYIGDQGYHEQLISRIEHQFELDGMQVAQIVIDQTGKIIVDARY